MHVIATAGHVDHGKSTLIRALTGMEPDRWAEERLRGMTIDLGYAWTVLPSGEQIAFVDVPGHERFATNMLAGVGPVPAVLLVIAADEGWATQTEEHVRALHALNVRHGLVAVTKSDLSEPSAAVAEASARLDGTSLEGIPLVTVSSVTGRGLAELRRGLDDLVSRLPAPDTHSRVRLWLDRSFTIHGTGTVVTGTLTAGTVREGDTLLLSQRAVRVRALQCLGIPTREVSGVARVAINLRGVAREEVHRGDSLLTPGAWHRTRVVDIRMGGEVVPAELVLHVGSASVPTAARVLSREQDSGVVRLQLAVELPLQVGDRVLLRDPGRRLIIAGATVLDPAPPSLVRRGSARARVLALRDDMGVPDLQRELIRRGCAKVALLSALGVSVPDSMPPFAVATGAWIIERNKWDDWRHRLLAEVEARSAPDLLDSGVGQSELAHLLGLPDPKLLTGLVAACPQLVRRGSRIRLRGRPAALRSDVATAVDRLIAMLRNQHFAAPEQTELAALGLRHEELGAAAAAGAILRLRGDIVLLPDAPDQAAQRLQELPQPFTLSTARQALGTTRRVAIPLLEYLDAIGVTERLADGLRRLRAGSA
jgi:selenocysteine-specific elongation factor